MEIYRGIVRGDVIVLPKGARLAEGSEVEVRVLATGHNGPRNVEAQFRQELLKLGLLLGSNEAGTGPETDQQPITVQGKPLSQEIIEERR